MIIGQHTSDKGAKTKPSIHTTKFKKMYGEVYELGTLNILNTQLI